MAGDEAAAVAIAQDYARQAGEVASRLKPGTWEATQALALTSIAHSLAVLAQRATQD